MVGGNVANTNNSIVNSNNPMSGSGGSVIGGGGGGGNGTGGQSAQSQQMAPGTPILNTPPDLDPNLRFNFDMPQSGKH
jgi:hypothetical protein